MDHPLFDDEIRKRLDDADVVICLISQPFLNSAYITTVEAKITFERLINEGILVVPVMLDACLWEDTEWLKALHHFPTEGYLQSSRKKSELYLEITKYIRKWYHNRATAFRDPKMVYKLRRLPEAQLSKEQVTNMLSGKYYVDVHNNSFLEGEIRGQIVKGSPVE